MAKGNKRGNKRLLQVRFIQNDPHTTWLANIVLVKKANKGW